MLYPVFQRSINLSSDEAVGVYCWSFPSSCLMVNKKICSKDFIFGKMTLNMTVWPTNAKRMSGYHSFKIKLWHSSKEDCIISRCKFFILDKSMNPVYREECSFNNRVSFSSGVSFSTNFCFSKKDLESLLFNGKLFLQVETIAAFSISTNQDLEEIFGKISTSVDHYCLNRIEVLRNTDIDQSNKIQREREN